jgi:hypothetical protein
MVGALLMGRRARAGLSWTLAAIVVAAFAPACTHPTCSDLHEPGCFTPPPDAGDDDAGDATEDATDASDDATGVDTSDGAIGDVTLAEGD